MKVLNIMLIAVLLIAFICMALSLTTLGALVLGNLSAKFAGIMITVCEVCVVVLSVSSAVVEIIES